ncbi:MAG: hypothetical protein ACREJ5_28030, partial [Geminicoccaceae bacterium]
MSPQNPRLRLSAEESAEKSDAAALLEAADPVVEALNQSDEVRRAFGGRQVASIGAGSVAGAGQADDRLGHPVTDRHAPLAGAAYGHLADRRRHASDRP